MAKTYEGIIQVGFPFEIQTHEPIDDRFVVDTFDDLLSLDNTYEGLPVYVIDRKSTYIRINGSSSTNSSDWRLNGQGGSTNNSFRYSSDTKKLVWEIEHNLQKYPSVVVTDTAGTTYEGNVRYIDDNKLTITFSVPFKGYADLN
jgi:hypothetical protein